jgi:hypothetical protein
LGYTYASFLAHEIGNDSSKDSFFTSKLGKNHQEILDESLQILNRLPKRTAELDGVRCAILIKKHQITLKELDDFIRQCDLDLNASITDQDQLEAFSHRMRRARLLGRRAEYKRKLMTNDYQNDYEQMDFLVNEMKTTLEKMKTKKTDTRIFSPFTRIHEPLSKIEEQLDERYTKDKFEDELKFLKENQTGQ